MNFADEIRQISNDRPKKLTDLEVYTLMLNAIYRSLQNQIRNNAKNTGKLSGTISLYESVDCIYREQYYQIEHKKTSLYEIDCYDGSYSATFTPFCMIEWKSTLFKNFCTVSLSDTGKKVSDELTRLFKADGIKVWYNASLTFEERVKEYSSSSRMKLTYSRDKVVFTELGASTELANLHAKPRLILHYEVE